MKYFLDCFLSTAADLFSVLRWAANLSSVEMGCRFILCVEMGYVCVAVESQQFSLFLIGVGFSDDDAGCGVLLTNFVERKNLEKYNRPN